MNGSNVEKLVKSQFWRFNVNHIKLLDHFSKICLGLAQ